MRIAILAAVCLTACTSLVPSTLAQLDQLSPTTADPADFAVAMELPEGLAFQPNSAQLGFTVSRSDTGQTISERFVLLREPGSQPVVYRVNEASLPAIRALQATARQWQAVNDEATQGSLSLSLSPCRIGEGPADDARISVAIRMEQNGPFLPLVRNGPISAVSDLQDLSELPRCVSTVIRHPLIDRG